LVNELARRILAEALGADGIPERCAAVGGKTRAKRLSLNRRLRWVGISRSGYLRRAAILYRDHQIISGDLVSSGKFAYASIKGELGEHALGEQPLLILWHTIADLLGYLRNVALELLQCVEL
jgi:hypothetical protein